MKSIKKTVGKITAVRELSKTSREVTITLEQPIGFIAGHFVNVFMEINGAQVRRAYSISSSDTVQDTISLSIRLNPTGTMSKEFWKDGIVGRQVSIMGALGLNDALKFTKPNAYLFAFGVGAGVVKSIADHLVRADHVPCIRIMTGSRAADEILHKDFFDSLSSTFSGVQTSYVVSNTSDDPALKRGYIQDHIAGFDFSNSDIYVCGQEAACQDLVNKIKDSGAPNSTFFIEGFH